MEVEQPEQPSLVIKSMVIGNSRAAGAAVIESLVITEQPGNKKRYKSKEARLTANSQEQPKQLSLSHWSIN